MFRDYPIISTTSGGRWHVILNTACLRLHSVFVTVALWANPRVRDVGSVTCMSYELQAKSGYAEDQLSICRIHCFWRMKSQQHSLYFPIKMDGFIGRIWRMDDRISQSKLPCYSLYCSLTVLCYSKCCRLLFVPTRIPATTGALIAGPMITRLGRGSERIQRTTERHRIPFLKRCFLSRDKDEAFCPLFTICWFQFQVWKVFVVSRKNRGWTPPMWIDDQEHQSTWNGQRINPLNLWIF